MPVRKRFIIDDSVRKKSGRPGAANRLYLQLLRGPAPLGLVLCWCLLFPPSAISDIGDLVEEMTTLSLEELLEVELFSAAKKPQKLRESTSASFIITSEDIRRSGAINIPEALRLAPGVNVHQIAANQWAISIRGFSGLYSNNLLVMIDGRSIYTPLFGGVYWQLQDLPLENIDRIEVVRGPGGTVWGANASQGIINILTRPAEESQGTMVTAGAGNTGWMTTARHGNGLDDDIHYIFYAKRNDYDNLRFENGESAHDRWQQLQGGFKVEVDGVGGRPHDKLIVQGDLHESDGEETVYNTSLTPPYNMLLADDHKARNHNIMAKWSREISEHSEVSFQAYYDHLDYQRSVVGQRQNTFDLEINHFFSIGNKHQINWGLGYRNVRDKIDNSFTVGFFPEETSNDLYSCFVQDEFILIPELFSVIVGTKYEKHSFSDDNLQPNIRFKYTPSFVNGTFWGAVSRAVRVPSRALQESQINYAVIPAFPNTMVMSIEADRRVKEEKTTAYELGYRGQLTDSFNIDIAGFYNEHSDMLSLEPGTAYFEPPSALYSPSFFDNLLDGESYGLEVSFDWQAGEDWLLTMNYSWLRIELHRASGSNDLTFEERGEEMDSEHQVQLFSRYTLNKNWEFDTQLGYYSERFKNESRRNVPDFFRFDMRLGWKPSETLELSLALKNLLDDWHPEIRDSLQGIEGTVPSEVPRSIFAQITWKL